MDTPRFIRLDDDTLDDTLEFIRGHVVDLLFNLSAAIEENRPWDAREIARDLGRAAKHVEYDFLA